MLIFCSRLDHRKQHNHFRVRHSSLSVRLPQPCSSLRCSSCWSDPWARLRSLFIRRYCEDLGKIPQWSHCAREQTCRHLASPPTQAHRIQPHWRDIASCSSMVILGPRRWLGYAQLCHDCHDCCCRRLPAGCLPGSCWRVCCSDQLCQNSRGLYRWVCWVALLLSLCNDADFSFQVHSDQLGHLGWYTDRVRYPERYHGRSIFHRYLPTVLWWQAETCPGTIDLQNLLGIGYGFSRPDTEYLVFACTGY